MFAAVATMSKLSNLTLNCLIQNFVAFPRWAVLMVSVNLKRWPFPGTRYASKAL